MSKVLIIGDDDDGLALLMELAGHDARAVRDDAEGVRVARGWHPDAVLCGPDTARALRSLPSTADARIVVIGPVSDALLAGAAASRVNLCAENGRGKVAT
jgi:hypothetical protein